MTFIKVVAAACMALTALSAGAVEIKAAVTHPYEGGIFSSGPTDEDKAKALYEAKLAVLKTYGSGMGLAEQKVFADIRPEVLANLDRYIPSWVIVAQDVDKGLKTMTLVIRATVDDSLINAEISQRMPAGAQATGDGSLISALFIARQTTSSTLFDEKVTKVHEDQSEREASSTGTESGVSESAGSRGMTTTGGSRTRKTSKESYSLLSTDDFDAAFNEVLSARGYETSSYADVYENCKGGASIDTIQKEVLSRDEITSSSRTKAIRAAKACEVRYFTIGRMDVSAPMRDSVTGNIKVMVSVTGRVWDISKKMPRNVASVGPVQYAGFGEDEATARRNALHNAATAAAKVVADTLQGKRIR